jgi:tetratricopeptide (TPR) repeat protein
MPKAQAQLDDNEDGFDLRTRIILATASMLSDGKRHDLEGAYANARAHGRLDEKLAGLIPLWSDLHRRGRYAAAGQLIDAADFLDAPDAGRTHRLAAAWLRGVNEHRVGRHARACEHLTWLLGEYTEAGGREFARLAGYDLETAALALLGLSECLRGNLDAGFTANDSALDKARALSSPISLKAVLRWRALMVYCFDEDSDEIDDVTREILSFDAIGDVDGPDGMGLAFRGLWLARGGDGAQGAQMVRRGLSARIPNDYPSIQSLVRAQMALQLLRHSVRAGIDEFAAQLEDDPTSERGWLTPEVLRCRGEIAERRGDLARAEARYRGAMALAERQDALTWRLRAATSLAELWRSQGRPEDAAALLTPVRQLFRPGTDWPLLRRADACLAACRAAGKEGSIA